MFGTILRILACITLGTTANLSDVLALDRVLLLLAHLVDLLLDDRILSLQGVLDDLGLLHLH